MIDANFDFLKLQGVSLSSGKVSRFYSRLESSEGIIGIPLKVIRLGNDIFLDLTRVRINNEKSLKMSDARLRRDVLQSKNSLPQAEKRLVRIPFLIQTREISGRMAGLIKRSKIINKKG